MDPKSDDVYRLRALLDVGNAESLKDLRNVTKVKGVVRLRWDWLKWACEDVLVDVQGGIHQHWYAVLNSIGEVCVEGCEDGREDGVHGLLEHLSVHQKVVVALKSLGDRLTTTSWRTHRGHKD